MQPGHVDFVRCLAAFLHDEFVDLFCHFFDDFFDLGWVNPAIGDQPAQRLPSHFAANRIESADDDHAWRIVNDDVHTSGFFKGTNIATFATDDPSLHVVGWDVDCAGGRFGGEMGRVALDRCQQHFAALRFHDF